VDTDAAIVPTGAIILLMADWLVLLLKFGGFGAVLLLALFVMGKWLLKRINAALDSYVAAYAQQTANIDARIANLEKLAQEQAHLTRTVEGIKDEIAAGAKNRDNRWAFRKDVYVGLITNVVNLINVHSRILSFRTTLRVQGPKEEMEKMNKLLEQAYLDLIERGNEFNISASLVQIATADTILSSLNKATGFQLPLPASPEFDAALRDRINNLSQFLTQLHFASRQDLWGTPEPTANVQAATQDT
jgi:hypothetical protein